jgi:hypothetical protein
MNTIRLNYSDVINDLNTLLVVNKKFANLLAIFHLKLRNFPFFILKTLSNTPKNNHANWYIRLFEFI